MEHTIERWAYTLQEVQAMLGLSKSGIWAMVKRGEIPTVMIGGRRLVTCEALKHVLEHGTRVHHENKNS